jgi:hypothetical protein
MKFKDARDKAMTEMFAKTYGKPAVRNPKNAPISGAAVSMGAKAPPLECEACAGGDTTHIHFSPLMSRVERTFPVEFLYATTVSAPKCEVCGAEMHGQDMTNWECRAEGCAERGKPVSAHLSGVYPIVSVPGR